MDLIRFDDDVTASENANKSNDATQTRTSPPKQRSFEQKDHNLVDIHEEPSEEEEPNEAELHRYWQDICKEATSITRAPGEHDERSKGKGRVGAAINITGGAYLSRDKMTLARVYNELIHSGKYTSRLVELEYSYWPAVEEMFKNRDMLLSELEAKSSQEIEEAIQQLGRSHTEASISVLSSQHCQDMERLLNNWNMTIEALKDAQREDFCEKLYELWVDWTSRNDETGGDSAHTSTKNKHVSNTKTSGDNKGDTSGRFRGEYTPSKSSEQNFNHIKMEESFTINLGSQLKTAHNLRILAADSLYLCDTQRNRSAQVRTQTAMSLYSHNLSAVVILVDNQFNSYCGIQHDFAQMCNSLSEFHFDSYNKQIKFIQENLMPDYAGRRNLQLGDCYVTRHSNLADVHVVFHLVTDDSLKNGQVNSRHAIMASLRNILRVAHTYDIKTISIPLLLVDEMDEEILTVNWCLKRAELVLKCVKGFLIEMASLSTGVEQGTIQFLVPKGISEELFANLAALIPEVFRLANSLNLKSTMSMTPA